MEQSDDESSSSAPLLRHLPDRLRVPRARADRHQARLRHSRSRCFRIVDRGRSGAPAIAKRTSIRVQVGRGGDPPRLEPIAGHPVHLVAVSSDLRWYEHFHPQGEGNTWTSGITFPVAGRYILYAIIRPPNGPQRVEKQIVIAGGETQSPSTQPLSASAREKVSGKYTVRLRTKPEPPEATIWSSLIFEISRDGAPVTNLTPTGRLGHMVVIGEGGEDFVYAHSTDGEALSGIRGRAHQPALPNEIDNDHRRHIGDTGPEVIFHAQFPRTGLYKIWVEFTAGGEPIRADFVLDVGPPKPVPHRD